MTDCTGWIPRDRWYRFRERQNLIVGYNLLIVRSLGYAAVFLLGSSSRLDPPIPIILRSGDVLVLSGRARQFYHGMSAETN